LPDVFGVARPRSERLHSQEMLRRGGEDASPDGRIRGRPPSPRLALHRKWLLVEPPTGQAQLSGHHQCFLEDDAMRLEEGIDVTGGLRESYSRAIAAPPNT
jgi:hypothetical protein